MKNPKISAKAKAFKRTDKYKKYQVKLVTNKNVAMKKAKVYVTVNKKTYAAYTANNGVATFKLTKLTKKGTYAAVVQYKGNGYYNAKSVKVKMVVK